MVHNKQSIYEVLKALMMDATPFKDLLNEEISFEQIISSVTVSVN